MTRQQWQRVNGGFQRRMARWLGRRIYRIPHGAPIVTFTFDDFPRSALSIGGAILQARRSAGTYFVALSLANQKIATGEMFVRDDVSAVIADGHELGCHTFDHHPAWATKTATYVASVCENARQLIQLGVQSRFQTHSFPISYPRPWTKRQVAGRFRCCRGGGQTFNRGAVDLNYVSSFFLEQSRDQFHVIESVLAENAIAGGWLIFSTHDISDSPSRFGCTPDFFERVVEASIQSGAQILSMSAALNALGVPPLR
jgi:peptidoglycan/xylan/chitin deacetylase (PgdA/CDA1 family)